MANGNGKDVITLENLIYGIRDSVGALKDEVFLGMGSKDAPFFVEDWKIARFCTISKLKEHYDRIQQTVGEILKDPLLAHENPLMSRAENEAQSMLYMEKAGNVIKSALPLQNGSITVHGLVVLSAAAKELYDTLKPVAEESKFYDHKTGLRISDWLMNNMFDYLKDYIANPTKNIALANIDLNNFSMSNGLVGKEQTDIVVAQFARVLKELPDGVAVRRTGERGDEFYICFKTDAEGAQTILKHKFVKPLEQKLMGYVKEACAQELNNGYNDAFEKAGYGYTCAIGVSSTEIPGSYNLLERASRMLEGNPEKRPLKMELDFLIQTPPEERAKAYRRELTDVRRGILVTLRQRRRRC